MLCRYGLLSPALWTLIMGLISHGGQGAEAWENALAGMKLAAYPKGIGETPLLLHETNCISLLLKSFKSNAVVKCMVVLPDTTDELYLRHNFKATRLSTAATLLETISVLTNHSNIRVQFRAPFLLLYAAHDFTTATVQVTDAKTWNEIQNVSHSESWLLEDYDWDRIQPKLQKVLNVKINPKFDSVDSYHFYRHSLAGYNLTGPELIEALALTGKTKVSINKNNVVFELDQRMLR